MARPRQPTQVDCDLRAFDFSQADSNPLRRGFGTGFYPLEVAAMMAPGPITFSKFFKPNGGGAGNSSTCQRSIAPASGGVRCSSVLEFIVPRRKTMRVAMIITQ